MTFKLNDRSNSKLNLEKIHSTSIPTALTVYTKIKNCLYEDVIYTGGKDLETILLVVLIALQIPWCLSFNHILIVQQTFNNIIWWYVLKIILYCYFVASHNLSEIQDH